MANDDYEIGYKRPPKATQFKKGQSGNPRGRLAGTRNFETDLREELSEMVRIREPGKRPYKVTKQRAMLKRLCAEAAKGKSQAMALFFKLVIHLERGDQPSDEQSVLTPDDQEILKDYLQRNRSRDDEKEPS